MVAITTALIASALTFRLVGAAPIQSNEPWSSKGMTFPSRGGKEPAKPHDRVLAFSPTHLPGAKTEDGGEVASEPHENLSKVPFEVLRTPLEMAKEDTPEEAITDIQHAKRADKQDWQDWPEDQKQLVIQLIIDEFHLHMWIAGIDYDTSVEEWTALVVLEEMQEWLVKESWQSVYQWVRDKQYVLNIVTAGECKMDAQGLFDLPEEWKCEQFCKEWGHC
ncbi:hypothetical protein G647_07527 [Cladophialophora carrionii CBS 160.54]|uniref:Uncharacterized protein n=1 Tax=Cladophialophora carrionii CBS 160.54 TaxID=1279043 RepID=V9D4G3_9EURO|nr:uncharacterized protein G647_07527 [Cladophialophora carrionii CBS 160.54]ETI21183.1 hypothetical protein G647_07527 [Cladophialophora carrionii CBS 160.54]